MIINRWSSSGSVAAQILFVCQAALLLVFVRADFYKLLGIARDATHKEIKKGVCARSNDTLYSTMMMAALAFRLSND